MSLKQGDMVPVAGIAKVGSWTVPAQVAELWAKEISPGINLEDLTRTGLVISGSSRSNPGSLILYRESGGTRAYILVPQMQ